MQKRFLVLRFQQEALLAGLSDRLDGAAAWSSWGSR
jgi:hypothetical protein